MIHNIVNITDDEATLRLLLRRQETHLGIPPPTQKIYSQFEDNDDEFTPDDIKIIFEPYTSYLEETLSQNGETSLFALFNEFMQRVIN